MKIKIFLRTACVWCYFIYEYAALKVALKMVPDPLLLLTFLARKVSPQEKIDCRENRLPFTFPSLHSVCI